MIIMIEGVMMKSRMDRYEENAQRKQNTPVRREDKNKGLYHDFYTNSTYTEFQDFDDKNVVDLSSIDQSRQTREQYQKIKEYQDIITPPKVKRDLDQFEDLYPTDENKVYDINNILLEAKKNRDQVDELERKRKLRSTQYNILANLDVDQLEKYREQKQKRRELERTEEEEIKELIDTITSNRLRQEIKEQEDKDLMSDLLPISLDETVVTESFQKSSQEEKQDMKKESNLENMDQSFYTKSMDLSDQDFEMDHEFEDVDTKKIPVAVKIILFILLIGVVTTIFYFVIQNI